MKFTDTQINKLEDTLKTNFKDNVDDVFNNNIPEHFLKYYDYPFLNDVSVKQIEAQVEIEKNGIIAARDRYKDSYNNLKVKSPSSHPLIKRFQNKVMSASVLAMENWLKQKAKIKSGPKEKGFEELYALGASKAVGVAMPIIHSGIENQHTMQKVGIKIGHAVQDQLFIKEAKAKDKIENDNTKKTARIITDSREIQSYHYRSRYVKRRLHRNDLVADITKWSNDFALAVGGLVIDCVYETGLYFEYCVEKNQVKAFKPQKKDKKTGKTRPKSKKWLVLTKAAKDFLDNNNAFLQWEDLSFPIMVIPPRIWDDENTGAYLTNHHRNKFSMVISRKQSQVSEIRKQRKADKLDELFNAVNQIQQTHFDISPFMHEVLHYCDKNKISVNGKPVEEIGLISVEDFAEINGLSIEFADWSQKDKVSFAAHRKAQRKINDEIERAAVVFSRDHATSELILTLKNGFWLPICTDWRMRFYPGPVFSYQRDDSMKSRFVFRKKKALQKIGYEQLMRQVGTFYGNGIDKLRISKRIDWVKDNHDKIVKTVENWKTDRFWLEADEPCQFLQNCKEYIDAVNSGNPHTFKSNVIIWNDASNSGLQHYSMERRDPVGAKDTNMTALDEGQEKSNDFYIKIRDAVEAKIKNTKWTNEYDIQAAKQWLKYGIKRGDVKTPAFTYFYNSKEWGMQDEVFDKTMKPLNEKMYSQKNFKHPFGDYKGSLNAARFMGSVIYNLVGQYAPAADEAMKFILNITGILSDFDINLKYVNPLGFPMLQVYEQTQPKPRTVRIPMYDFTFKMRHPKSKHDHQLKVRTSIPNTVCREESLNGACPNTVHCNDATQMGKAVNYATSLDNPNRITHIAVNHDCVGTHACDAGEFVECYKMAGIELYLNHSFLEDIYNYAKECIGEEFEHPKTGEKMKLPVIPPKLGWDIEEYYHSELSIS